jgi:hypothetical protein
MMTGVNAHLYVPVNKLKTPPKLCKDCRHYVAPPAEITDARFGKCAYFAKMCLIDGSLEYPFVGTIRETTCKDSQYWESALKSTHVYED